MKPASTPADLSVAMCTHNGAPFIEAQLRSILSQVPAPAEVVLSDDASSDDTVAIAERVAAEFGAGAWGVTGLKVIRNEAPLGVTANFEQAVRACSGETIALSDQDDVWHEGRLERLVAVFADRPGLLAIASDATLVDGEGAPLSHTLFSALVVSRGDLAAINRGEAFARLMKRNVFTGATMAFRRKVLDVALPFPESWLHDEWLAAIAAAMGEVALVEEELVDYRQHGANQVGASKVSLKGKIARLVEPRGGRNERLLARAQSLVERAHQREDAFGASSIAVAEAKYRHEQTRSALHRLRVRRLVPVAREFIRGGYGAHGRGMQDVARDLLQPARESGALGSRRFSGS